MCPAQACSPPVRARVAAEGLSRSGALCLLAVVAVLIVVSLPRLRGIALQENEVDARATAALLARELGRSSAEAPPPIAELLGSRNPALPPSPGLPLSDVELLEQGRLLRRHGYLFQLVRLPLGVSLACAALTPSTEPRPSSLAVRAWPWRHGQTGSAAFLVTQAGAVYRHPNRPLRWEGLEGEERRVPDTGDWARAWTWSGWQTLP